MIEVIPAEGVSYLEMYKAIRTSSHLEGFQQKIGVGTRTPKDTLRLPLSRDVDSAEVCQRIREVIGEKDAASIRTEMSEVLVTGIDSLANEEQLRKAVLTALGKEHSDSSIDMWDRRDSTKRARVRLPRTDAKYLVGKRLLLGYTSCWISCAELKAIAGDLHPRKAPGLDGMPNAAVTADIRKYPESFVAVYQRCLDTGSIPQEWKRQKLVLLPKPGKQPGEASSCRPICLINNPAKVLERLNEHLENPETPQLADNQFGFRKQRSTMQAIQLVVDACVTPS
ncbi:uncharacterized protein LOC126564231 [Anopheles maculipalpis]|uniref:uncharacterized protein LOC126564231 n=1 Tax=Anopheles maculipalpis TaxID=1496333 RepID=UPI0021597B12|nr:uncharacterized protein LOC126564231 [Anopheles maculipalpis]